jgi:hypothetical protein
MENPIFTALISNKIDIVDSIKYQDYLKVYKILCDAVNFAPDLFLHKGKVIQLYTNALQGGYDLTIISQTDTICGESYNSVDLSYNNIARVAVFLEETFN